MTTEQTPAPPDPTPPPGNPTSKPPTPPKRFKRPGPTALPNTPTPKLAAATSSGHDFGPTFEHLLRDACNGKLSEISWFRTDWQRGGAATGYATIHHDNTTPPRDVVVKFPLGPAEYKILTDLDLHKASTPRIAHHGVELGSFDLAWIVMERLPGEPLKSIYPEPNKKLFTRVADAAARFYRATTDAWTPGIKPEPWDWHKLVEQSRESCKTNPIPNAQHWNKVLHDVAKHLTTLVGKWETRACTDWCHGDLHLNNIMERPPQSPWFDPALSADPDNPEPQCILIDFGEVHPGHWVEDATYLERVYWANPDISKKVKFVPLFAKARKKLGLPCEDDYATLAQIRRVLMASCAPAWIHRENHPAYLDAALNTIEKTLPLLTK